MESKVRIEDCDLCAEFKDAGEFVYAFPTGWKLEHVCVFIDEDGINLNYHNYHDSEGREGPGWDCDPEWGAIIPLKEWPKLKAAVEKFLAKEGWKGP